MRPTEEDNLKEGLFETGNPGKIVAICYPENYQDNYFKQFQEENRDNKHNHQQLKNKIMITAERYHDISCGHRVYGHESKCAHLHGHNYRFHFKVRSEKLDNIGRVIDFSVIKSILCNWLEKNWDHKFLVWRDDPSLSDLKKIDPLGVVEVPFNPTAENMAIYLVEKIAPEKLKALDCILIECRIEETRKCSASYKL